MLVAPPDEALLADEEVVAVLVDILFGGYKTTAALIGNSVEMLLRARDAWQDLRAHPTQIPLAVEEALRYDTPIQAMVRTATRAVVLPGATEPVQPETQVLLLYGAGNRDPDVFQQADAIDLQRKLPHHLAFGYGVHVCVGAPRARLEGRVALETLLRRLPNLQLGEGQELTHVPTLMFRSLERLEVTWRF
jgi:cytochrome P450